MLWGFIVRLLILIKELLIWIDQGLHILLGAPKFLLVGGPVPSADETISSKVGRNALLGKRWALVCQWFIDRLFYVFEGFRLGHCRRAIEKQFVKEELHRILYGDIDWEDANRL